MVKRLKDSYRDSGTAETIEVITAIPLGESDKLRLERRFADMVGRPVVLKAIVDDTLIGGMIIRAKNKLIDGSLRSKLNALKQELQKGELEWQ